MVERCTVSRGPEGNTYCCAIVPGGYNLIGRRCNNVIPLGEQYCSECRVRLEKKEEMDVLQV